MKKDYLLEEAEKLETMDFKTKEEAKKYSKRLSEKLQEEEEMLTEELKKLENKIWEYRHAQSKVFDYYLSIR